MFGITNQTYTGEGDFLVGFCLVCRLQGGIYYFFLQNYSIDQAINQTKNKEMKSKQNEKNRF